MKIDPEKLIGDPLYQCNLLLWMLQPSTGATVKPLLQKAGYRLRFIEPKMPLPVAISNKLNADALPTAENAEPELLAWSNAGDFLILECKRSMFGYQVGQNETVIRQCRAFLLQIPQILAESQPDIKPSEIASTHLLYLSKHNAEEPQFDGVKNIAAELESKDYRTATHGLLTLDISAGEIGLRTTDSHGTLPSSLALELPRPFTPLQTIPDADTDPRPLYYMPWMPDSEPKADEYNQNAFGNRILGCAAAEIGVAQPPCDVELNIETLLNSATNDFYKFWRDRDSKKHVRQHAVQLLRREITKADGEAVFQKQEPPKTSWKLTLAHTKMQSRIVEHFRKWKSEVWLKPAEPDFFPDL